MADVDGSAERRRRAAARRQHDRRHAGGARRAQHRRAGVRPVPRARRGVRSGGHERARCSAPAAPLGRARWRSPGRARPGSWSPCGNRRAHRAARAALDGLDTTVEVVSFDGRRTGAADLDRERHPARRARRGAPAAAARRRGSLVVDLLYRPAITPLQQRRRAAPVRSRSAAWASCCTRRRSSFELWTGQPAPLEVMSAAAVAAIGRAPDRRTRPVPRRVVSRRRLKGGLSAPTMPPAEDPWMNTPRSRSASC